MNRNLICRLLTFGLLLMMMVVAVCQPSDETPPVRVKPGANRHGNPSTREAQQMIDTRIRKPVYGGNRFADDSSTSTLDAKLFPEKQQDDDESRNEMQTDTNTNNNLIDPLPGFLTKPHTNPDIDPLPVSIKKPQTNADTDPHSRPQMDPSSMDPKTNTYTDSHNTHLHKNPMENPMKIYTRAVALGVEFQAEDVCPQQCGVDHQSRLKKRKQRYIYPTCGDCYCDESCLKYEDCCYHGNVQTQPETTHVTTKLLCFQYDPGFKRGAALVSSCPRLEDVHGEKTLPSIPSSDDININNHHDSSFQTHVRGCLQCSKSSDEEWNPVSSSVTNLTYCNDHCLECNEPQLEASHRLPWAKVAQKQCRASSSTRSRSRSRSSSQRSRSSSPGRTKRDSLRLQQDCRLQFLPSFRERYVRPCIPEGHLKVIDTCSDTPLEDVDNETFLEMKSLCQAYRWPVYTDDAVFNNIFCFLCQGFLPTPVASPQQFHKNDADDRAKLPSLSTLTRMTLDVTLEVMANDVTDGDEPFQDGYHSDMACGSGFWFNYLTVRSERNCTPLRCSNGRILTQSNSSESPNERHCHGSNKEKYSFGLESEEESQLYVLNVLWYVDSHDDTNDVTSRIMEDFQNVDNVRGQGHQNVSLSCDVTMMDFQRAAALPEGPRRLDALYDGQLSGTDLHSVSPKNEVQGQSVGHPAFIDGPQGYVRGPSEYTGQHLRSALRSPRSISAPPGSIAGAPGSMATADGSKETAENGSSTLTEFDAYLMNQTHRKLLDLNVSYFLLKVLPGKDADQNNSVLDGVRQIVVYFQKSARESIERNKNGSEFAQVLLEYFSDSYVFNNGSGGTFQMRSLFVQKHRVYNTTMKSRYFDSAGINVNGTACCREIDMREFSHSLSSMACDQGTVKPVNVHLTSTCAHVILNSTDFNMTTSQTLIHRETGIRLERHQYLLSERGMRVCASVLDSLRPPMAAKTADRQHEALHWWEELLTRIFLPISMLCLLVTFITYCIFPVLRSLPGKNNMFLVFWLFWAQTLILATDLAPSYSLACVVMAILLHYSWLVTLAWTCVCSFHMFNVFVLHKGVSNDDKSHRWYITCYSLISHVIPLLVVASVCLSNTFSTGHASLGYGGAVCYLNSALLVGVAFVLPLAAVLLTNMIFFFSTIAAISRVEKIKRQTGIGEKRNTHTYARLSSLTSITWCLALLAEIPGCRYLSLLSIVVNSSQGVFLFVSYILNARVNKLWGSFRRKNKDRTSAVNTHTNTNTNTNSITSTRMYTLNVTR